MNSPLNYLGGKSRLAKKIVSMLPDHTCYCEPFCGAAWVLFQKPPSPCEVINDKDGELITFWRVIQNHLEEFLRYFKYAVVSRKLFDLENKKAPETLTDIQRAVRYYYLQRLGFGGKTFKRTFGTAASRSPGLNLTDIEERLLEVHWRLHKVVIEHLDACACIARYDRPGTLFYIDPPYWRTAGYAVPFGDDDLRRVRDALKGLSGRFMLSINDVAPVREIFAGFRQIKVVTTYSSANPRTDKSGATRAAPRAELIVTNIKSRSGARSHAEATEGRR